MASIELQFWPIVGGTFLSDPISHGFIVLKDDKGRVVKEIHGDAYNSKTLLGAPSFSRVNIGSDGDVLLVSTWETKPGHSRARFADLPGNYIAPIYSGPMADMENMIDEMQQGGRQINDHGMPYHLHGIFDEGQNSNSVALTLVGVGKDTYESGRYDKRVKEHHIPTVEEIEEYHSIPGAERDLLKGDNGKPDVEPWYRTAGADDPNIKGSTPAKDGKTISDHLIGGRSPSSSDTFPTSPSSNPLADPVNNGKSGDNSSLGGQIIILSICQVIITQLRLTEVAITKRVKFYGKLLLF